MDYRQSYRKYQAAKEAVDRHQGDLEQILAPIAKRYLDLYYKLNPGHFRDYYPESVDNISRYGEDVTISGTRSRRGCTDSESCRIPLKLVTSTPEEREVFFANMQRQIDDRNSRLKAEKEQTERALLASLQQRYGETS